MHNPTTHEEQTGIGGKAANKHVGLQAGDDLMDFGELWLVLWKGKWIIALSILILGSVALAYALLQPNIYESEVVLVPVIDNQNQSLMGLAGEIGGLASLAGIDLGSASTDRATLALEVLQSRAFLADFIDRHELLLPVMATKSWDMETGEWSIDPKLYDTTAKKWVRKVVPPKQSKPSDIEIAKKINDEMLDVQQDSKTGLVTISLSSLSPLASQQWLSWIIADLNQRIREMDMEDSKKSIEFLREQIEKTPIADMRQVFYGLIEQQTRTMMLAQVRAEYVFKTVDPPVLPDRKSKPMRALIVALGVVVGGMLGVFLVVVRHHFVSKRP